MKPTVEQWLADGRRSEPNIDASLKTWELRHYPLRKRDAKKTKRAPGVNIYLPDETLAEVRLESSRYGQTLSQVLQRAWLLARDEVKKFPTYVVPSEP